MKSQMYFRVLVVIVCLAMLTCGCAGLGSQDGQDSQNLGRAQINLRFRIRVPSCIPPNVNPKPSKVTRNDNPETGYQSVSIEYQYLVRPQNVPGNFGPAVAIMEQQNKDGESVIFMTGKHEYLDGVEASVVTGPMSPAIEWIQDRTSFQIVTPLTWVDALGIYHSMVTGAANCDQPKRS